MSEPTTQPVILNPVSRRKRLKGFYDYSLEELAEHLQTVGAPAFRAKQFYNWAYENFVTSYDENGEYPRQTPTRDGRVPSVCHHEVGGSESDR